MEAVLKEFLFLKQRAFFSVTKVVIFPNNLQLFRNSGSLGFVFEKKKAEKPDTEAAYLFKIPPLVPLVFK